MLFKEVSKGIGTKCVPASDEEVEKAKKLYKETKKCDHRFIYDEVGYSDYDFRYCGICGKLIGLI